MHKLMINKLGPIDKCELECSQFIVLTGFQASGKSTIAKTIYYFRTIKEDIEELAKKQTLNRLSINDSESKVDLKKGLINHLREKFLSTFGSSWAMSKEMYIQYHFTETCFIKISLKNSADYPTPNCIWVTFSDELANFLKKNNNYFSIAQLGIPEEEIKLFKSELYKMFDDCCSVVYIPAGRSMITLLSQQINYIYAKMDDIQKRSLDTCTKDYLERILYLKPEFSQGLIGLMSSFAQKSALSSKIIKEALNLIKLILRGTYRYSNGEEQILLDNGKYVKINFSSSGQQECIWILNLLFYYLLQQNPILFIIEEPESHLFPESQKYITELIAMTNTWGHSVVLTTHSPYVLGTLNNLLYAHTVGCKYPEKTNKIISKSFWVNFNQFDSWFVKNGKVQNCMDSEIHMIQNERIDEISKVINNDFDQILNLQNEEERI